ncbi:MAG TPA: hypothetical protein PK280_19710, partial [Planctomycetota bacterium]|nr:hypothetical protein [Planctomycetota bacterium]
MIRNVLSALGLGCSLALAMGSAVALAGQPAAPVQQEEFNDTILLTNNNPVTPIRIVEDRWDAVVYRLPGGPAEGNFCPADTVESVVFASRPSEYDKALELKRAGKSDEAIKALDDGMKKLGAKDSAQRQYFQMAKIECLLVKRDPAGVGRLVDEMLAAGKDNPPRMIFQAYEAFAAANFQNRKFPETEKVCTAAGELFKKLEDKARSGGKEGLAKMVNRHRLGVKLLCIQCLELQGKIEGPSADSAAELAYQLYPSQDGAAVYPDLIAQADIGRGRCMALRKNQDFDGALKHLEGLEKKVPTSGLSSLYAAMGDIYVARAGSEKKDELDWYQARWYYLKVVVQYPDDRAALAKAYYGAGVCFEALAKEGPRASERRRKMFETVKKDFPD